MLAVRAVPPELQQRIHEYFDFVGLHEGFQQEDERLKELPDALNFHLEVHAKRAIFLAFPVFKNSTIDQIKDLVSKTEHCYEMPGRYLLREGYDSPGLLMIVRGSVEVFVHGAPVATRRVGETLGEASLLEDKPASADCLTLEWVEYMLLRRTDFPELTKRHPELRKMVVSYALNKDSMQATSTLLAKLRSEMKIRNDHRTLGRSQTGVLFGGSDRTSKGAGPSKLAGAFHAVRGMGGLQRRHSQAPKGALASAFAPKSGLSGLVSQLQSSTAADDLPRPSSLEA